MKKNVKAEAGTASVAELLAMKNKFTKQIVTTAIIAVVACVGIFSAVTVAWFASNRQVNSDGMNMEIDTDVPFLIIEKSASDISTATVEDISVSYSEVAASVTKPATHDDSAGDFKLKYVTDTDNIGVTTGLAIEGSNTFANVIEANKANYFKDVTVYIASVNEQMSDVTKLMATLTTSDTITGDANEWRNATAIDFYVNGTYSNRIHLSNGSTAVELNLSNGVPLNTAASNNYITVTMRCYYDGAWTGSGSNAYIRSENIPTVKNSTVNVKFVAASN